MRVRAGLTVGVAVLIAAVSLAGCDDGPRAAATPAVDSPTYLPADLPGGFGANPVRYVRRTRGYTLTAKAHDTTYMIDVTTRLQGAASLNPDRLATLGARTNLQPDGTLSWRDQVADVSISAAGPAGHTRRGLQTIGKRMVVVPQPVLDAFVAASRARRSRQVELDPIEFSQTSIPQSMYGRLGRATFSITRGKVVDGTGVCFACERPSLFFGWREGGTIYVLGGLPPTGFVEPTKGVQVERRFDPMAGSDLVLLSTERRDQPRVTVGVPGEPPLQLPMQESTL